jgi:LuxR family maltose regulon positive regulatory protein
MRFRQMCDAMRQATAPCVQARLQPPPLPAATLPRAALSASIEPAPHTRLLLITAPAGYGKTTLLTQACAQRAAAWLTLDAGDNDPGRFLRCLSAAVGRACGGAPPATLAGIAELLMEQRRSLLLVLDDYHAITEPAVHRIVAALLDLLPERVCMAIGSRSIPPLPIGRLRARDQLIERSTKQLLFAVDEIGALLGAYKEASPRDLLHAIASESEGWPAAVRLAARALQNAPAEDRHTALAQSRRQIFAYFAEEVFDPLPPHLRSFLLQTAILDRMCSSLCDTLILGEIVAHPKSGPGYSRRILETMLTENLFITPLDPEQRWYRYHPLFRAFLRARLDVEPPHLLAELQRRAAAWHRQNTLTPPTTCTVVEPLSERELEVLQLVAGGAMNHDIAETLVISVGTVKSHINHILGKLAARNRTEAVSHARELHLLASSTAGFNDYTWRLDE